MPAVGDLVLIEWQDIQTDHGWESMTADVKPAECKSVGFVTSAIAGRYVVLAGMVGVEVSTKSGETNLRQSIPWGCVSNWRLLGPRRR